MSEQPRLINLALLGFGHVGRAFARLLLDRRKWFLKELGLEWRITGIATSSHGVAIDSAGFRHVFHVEGIRARHDMLADRVVALAQSVEVRRQVILRTIDDP